LINEFHEVYFGPGIAINRIDDYLCGGFHVLYSNEYGTFIDLVFGWCFRVLWWSLVDGQGGELIRLSCLAVQFF
jgi:hypothetical protein